MVTGVACGLQNRRGAPIASWVGSIPTRSRLFLTIAALVLAPSLQAQEPAAAARDSADPRVAPDTVPVVGDSLPVAGDSLPESAVITQAANLEAPADTGQEGEQAPVTPMGAFVRSLVIPGWGQAAVDQPGRGAFYFAAGTFSLFMVIKSQAELDAARRANPPDLERVDDKTGQRETWIVLWIFISLFAGVDAWVSAHLWDFEGEITPPDDGSPGVQFQYNVPVEGP